MKKTLLSLSLLAPVLLSAMEPEKSDKWWVHPKSAEITPSNLLKLAALPTEHCESVEAFATTHKLLLSRLTSMPKKLSTLKNYFETNKELIEASDLANISRSNYVFILPESNLVVKIGGEPNKYALLRAAADCYGKTLDAKEIDALPRVKTYQTASRALTAQLVALTSDKIIIPRTYLYSLNPEATKADDTSVICVQERIKALDTAQRLSTKTEEEKAAIAELAATVSLDTFKEFLALCRTAGLWCTDGNVWIKDGSIIYPDLEQPNNTKVWLLDNMPKFRANGQVGVRLLINSVYAAGDVNKLKAGFDSAIAIAYEHLEQLNEVSGKDPISTDLLDTFQEQAEKAYEAKELESLKTVYETMYKECDVYFNALQEIMKLS